METLGNKFATSINNGFDTFVEKLKTLFIPKFDCISQIKSEFDSRFGFVNQLGTIIKGFFTDISDDAPIFSINYQGKDINIIDFTIFAPYRQTLEIITSVFLLWNLYWWLLKVIPSVIAGLGGVK